MKQLLNTLYITMPETYLACSGNDIIVMLDQKCIAKRKHTMLNRVVC